jgi:hypothetical protein
MNETTNHISNYDTCLSATIWALEDNELLDILDAVDRDELIKCVAGIATELTVRKQRRAVIDRDLETTTGDTYMIRVTNVQADTPKSFASVSSANEGCTGVSEDQYPFWWTGSDSYDDLCRMLLEAINEAYYTMIN